MVQVGSLDLSIGSHFWCSGFVG